MAISEIVSNFLSAIFLDKFFWINNKIKYIIRYIINAFNFFLFMKFSIIKLYYYIFFD